MVALVTETWMNVQRMCLQGVRRVTLVGVNTYIDWGQEETLTGSQDDTQCQGDTLIRCQ